MLALLGTALGLLAAAGLVVFVALPKLLPLLGISYRAPFAPTPPPTPAPRPTPAPGAMDLFDPAEAETEVVFDASSNYRWFGDPYFYKGKMILSAGKLVDTKAVLLDLYYCMPESRAAQKIDLTPQNAHFMFPKFNERWLVYLDAKLNGGGTLMALDLANPSATPVAIKDIYAGQPEPMLDGDYVAFTDRTGTRMDKLFICDLTTFETTVVHMFSNNAYGQSLPFLHDGLLIWADVNSTGEAEAEETSVIYSVRIDSGALTTYNPGTYVHDPETNGTYTAWLDAPHAPQTSLYYSREGERPVKIASGVVEFGMEKTFIAYCKGETIYAYRFDNGKTYRISSDYEKTQFLGVSDSCVIWMDVTSRERDIIKFSRLP